MKTQQRLHTHLLFFLLLTVFTTSCVGIFKKKEDDPEPQLAGVYQISSYQVTVGTQRIPGTAGTVNVTGPTNNQVGVIFNLTNPSLGEYDFGDYEARKNGSSYDMYNGNTKVGSLNGTDFNFDAQGADGDGRFIRLEVTAKK